MPRDESGLVCGAPACGLRAGDEPLSSTGLPKGARACYPSTRGSHRRQGETLRAAERYGRFLGGHGCHAFNRPACARPQGRGSHIAAEIRGLAGRRQTAAAQGVLDERERGGQDRPDDCSAPAGLGSAARRRDARGSRAQGQPRKASARAEPGADGASGRRPTYARPLAAAIENAAEVGGTGARARGIYRPGRARQTLMPCGRPFSSTARASVARAGPMLATPKLSSARRYRRS